MQIYTVERNYSVVVGPQKLLTELYEGHVI